MKERLGEILRQSLELRQGMSKEEVAETVAKVRAAAEVRLHLEKGRTPADLIPEIKERLAGVELMIRKMEAKEKSVPEDVVFMKFLVETEENLEQQLEFLRQLSRGPKD